MTDFTGSCAACGGTITLIDATLEPFTGQQVKLDCQRGDFHDCEVVKELAKVGYTVENGHITRVLS